MRGQRSWLAVVAGFVVLAIPCDATAATSLGSTFDPENFTGCENTTALQTVSPGGLYAAPFAGVITSWSFQADPVAPQIRLKVGRPAGGNNFTIVGESELETALSPSTLNTFPTRISVAAGDLLGIFGASPGPCGALGQAGYDLVYASGANQPPGSTTSYTAVANQRIDISAILEGDADNDGYGDETQDCAPNNPALNTDCAVPETQITKGPKDKTKKKTATFEFAGSDARAVASFQCSLDGGAFETCTSPHTVKVKKGKHTFEVRALDQAGNVGAPASDDWKVKKKKKKK